MTVRPRCCVWGAERMRALLLALAMAIGLVGQTGSAAAAPLRMFAYDAADAATRRASGALTFEFRQHWITTQVTRVNATYGQASASLREAQDRDLGAPLGAIIGETARERDLYEVMPDGEGAAMVRAFCPGATRAWLAMGRLRANLPLRVHVLGSTTTGGAARVCTTLNFDFHGEWRGPRPRDSVPQNAIRSPRFPF